jgi:hypothetical protein
MCCADTSGIAAMALIHGGASAARCGGESTIIWDHANNFCGTQNLGNFFPDGVVLLRKARYTTGSEIMRDSGSHWFHNGR